MNPIKCTECGKGMEPGEVVWVDYLLMNTDDLIATMPYCKSCVKKIEGGLA